jgi:hypothetical protein
MRNIYDGLSSILEAVSICVSVRNNRNFMPLMLRFNSFVLCLINKQNLYQDRDILQ